MKAFKIYSTLASAYFARLIADRLGAAPSAIIRQEFGDGELYHRLPLDGAGDLIGQTAIFVASTNSDKDFDELEKIGHTLTDAGTARNIFVMPFFGYSTMERAVLPGEAISAKINARRLSHIPGRDNVFLILDLHSPGILHYFEGDCRRFELSAEKILSQAIAELKLKEFVFGTADLGKTRLTETLAGHFKTGVVYASKNRKFTKTKVADIIGDVKGKNIIIYDDMTRSGGTLIQAAQAYLKRGAVKIFAVISHLALNNEKIIKKLAASPLEKIIATNSHPISQHKSVRRSGKIEIKDISGEFAEVIKKLI